ncbi:MAG: CDP-glycerol glycerophosphotransferase family protein [Spirochaetaceae bacterium]|jgi:hypothetical protein|nr:CDP-glycerol glycerophosphotransferase family protein [Spirochaetaceae bacterium]
MKIAYVFFFLFLCTASLPAYIDPGTGSMLFSLLTGLTVTIFFFFRNLIIRLKSGALFRKKGAVSRRRHSLVLYSEGKQYWNVFKPVLEELLRREIPAVYYTSGEDDPGLAFPAPPELLEKAHIGKGNAAYRTLNFLEADICLMTTPSLDVFQLKRSPGVSCYAHLVHAPSDMTLYRLFAFDYYDALFLSGEYQKSGIRKLEALRGTKQKKLFVTGCTYLDVLAERAEKLPPRKAGKTVLVAPSWGSNALLKRFGMRLLRPLAQSSWRVIIRPHPQSLLVETDTITTLKEQLAPFRNVSWNYDSDNLEALAQADILLSDFSGIVFDFAFLFERPVLYPRFDFDRRPYDAGDIEEEPWTFRALREFGVPLEERSFAEIETVLEGAGGTERREAVRKLRAEAYQYPGEAGKRTADALEALQADLRAGPQTSV